MAMHFIAPDGRPATITSGFEVEVLTGEAKVSGVVINSGDTAGTQEIEDCEPGCSMAILEAWMRHHAPDGASFLEVSLEARLPATQIPTPISVRVVSPHEDVTAMLDRLGLGDRVPGEDAIPMALVGDARFVGEDAETCILAVLAIPTRPSVID